MIITHITTSLGSGGIQGFVQSLACEQVKLGHDVYVIVIQKYTSDFDYIMENVMSENGVKIFCLQKEIHNKISLVKTILLCRKVIKRINPDIINSHGVLSHIYGSFCRKSKRPKHIITLHCTPELWPKPLYFFCRNVPLIACSQAAYDGRVQRNKLVVCSPNGVSPDLVRTDMVCDIRKELGLDSSAKIVVSVGNMRAQKNYDNLIELANHYKGTDVHFCICGWGWGTGYDDPLKYYGYPNLHVLGERSDVSAIENSANLFLSSSKFEGLPIAVLEAYFNGIPCVLSPIKEHIQISKVSKVWIPKDFSLLSFVNSIDEALNTTDSHDCIYKERKNEIEQFSISRTANEYILYYKQFLKS